MSTEQQYRVIGKSGPGVEPVVGMVVRWRHAKGEPYRLGGNMLPITAEDALAAWNAGDYDILEAISPPQAAVATCADDWCGLPYEDDRVPGRVANLPMHAHVRGPLCWRDIDEDGRAHGPAYCTQACLDRAKAAKAPECIRSACKAPPVAGGELCAAHAGQVETAKTGTAPAARCGHTGPLSCGKCADCTAAPVPAHAETRLERWRREHKGYQKLPDAEAASAMMCIDNYGRPAGADRVEERTPPPKAAPWTPRDLDGDIPDAWEPGGARLGCTR